MTALYIVTLSFNLRAEHIIWNVRLDELQIRVKIAQRNVNSLSYTDGNHCDGRQWKGTKEPLDEGEREEWKSQLKTQC